MVTRRVVVRGRVQGVGFRWATRREAQTRGLRGWVRNADDGSVEALVHGDDEAVEAMVAWLSRGPDGASVEGLEVSGPLGDGSEGGDRFEIRH